MDKHKLALWGIYFLIFALYLGMVLLTQHLAGATSTSFGYMPDEPAHYVSSLMIHDYFRSGLAESPLKFAASYYLHLPYFAVGYWPPVFYVVTALWMFAFGSGREAVLGLTALITAALCFTTFLVSTRWLSLRCAVLIGLLPLLIPEVLWQSCFIMIDLPIALSVLWAALAFERYIRSPEPLPAVLFSLCATVAILSKYSGAFICALPFLMVIALRRFDLLRRWTFWFQPALIAALCAPWVLSTRALASYGLPANIASRTGSFLLNLIQFVRATWKVVGWEFCLCAALGFVLVLFFKPSLRAIAWLLAGLPILLLLFFAASPVGPEGRYLLPIVAPCSILIGLGWHVFSARCTTNKKWLAALLLVPLFLFQAAKLGRDFPHLQPNEYAKLAESILARPDWQSSLFLAPEQGEGPFIAELAMRDSRRPSLLVARPKKILADMDWLGNSKRLRYTTPMALQAFFDESPIDYVVIRRDALSAQSILGRIVIDTVSGRQDSWQEVSRMSSPCSGNCAPWQVFHRLPAKPDAILPNRTEWLAQREFLRLYERRPDLPLH